jgi:hypothetical protein
VLRSVGNEGVDVGLRTHTGTHCVRACVCVTLHVRAQTTARPLTRPPTSRRRRSASRRSRSPRDAGVLGWEAEVGDSGDRSTRAQRRVDHSTERQRRRQSAAREHGRRCSRSRRQRTHGTADAHTDVGTADLADKRIAACGSG